MDFEIVTDSCCNLLEDMIDDFGIHVLPLTFMVDGEDEVYQSYLKGERTDLKQFYTMMREGKVFKHVASQPGRIRGALPRAARQRPRRALHRVLERPVGHLPSSFAHGRAAAGGVPRA